LAWYGGGIGGYNGFLSLSCSGEQVDQIARLGLEGDYSELIVVASVVSFRRPRLSILAEYERDEDYVEDYLWIETNNEIAILYGRLIDVYRLPSDLPEGTK
jgi:hypothetical protein